MFLAQLFVRGGVGWGVVVVVVVVLVVLVVLVVVEEEDHMVVLVVVMVVVVVVTGHPGVLAINDWEAVTPVQVYFQPVSLCLSAV